MECHTYLRNVTDLWSDGKTSYERRFGQPFKWPIIPFGSLVEYHPTTAKDQSRIHQFGKKVLPGLFLGYALYAGGIWKGDVLAADLEELETMDASEIYSKRLNAKEVIFPKEKGEFIFPIADGRIKPLGGDQDLRTSTLIRQRPIQGESQATSFGPCQETSYTAITLNLESSFTRREKNHSLFHWNTLTSPELHIRIWISSKRNASMIFGISMGQVNCLFLGQVPLDLFHWKKNLQTDFCGPWEINEKTADIQARSFVARTLGQIGKECQAEREAKVVEWKEAPSGKRTKIARDLFHWPEGQGIQGDHQECS